MDVLTRSATHRTAVSPAPADTALISMPFGPISMPSIGLGLLSAGLASKEIRSRTLYFNLKFAGRLGTERYIRISRYHPPYDQIGDWIFSAALFGDDAEATQRYIDEILKGRTTAFREGHYTNRPYPDEHIEMLLEARRLAPAFLEECAAEVLATRPRIVGFTTTFEQNVASLGLARLIKEAAPETLIVFGGANCEGSMGKALVRHFPFVDVAVSGEGDTAFPLLAEQFLRDGTIPLFKSVSCQEARRRRSRQLMAQPAPPVVMDALPFCEYDDFFEQVERYGVDAGEVHWIPFETSRGCWWGEKHHCTFCGLNGAVMTYRSKSDQRAFDELLYLTDRYPNRAVQVVDNILDTRYFKTLLPRIAELDQEFELFYEVKANLKKEQLRLMKRVGITSIQPGIESLSTEVLALMRKGISGIQNVQLLKWSKELGIDVQWNILWGFPGETAEGYAETARLIPLLVHLQPPASVPPIRLDRFSPNFDQAEQMGFRDVAPYPAALLTYHALPPEAVFELSYYFIYDQAHWDTALGYTRPVAEQWSRWQRLHPAADLFFVDKGSSLLLWDLRDDAPDHRPVTVLDGARRLVYLGCDAIRTAASLSRDLGLEEGAVQAALDDLTRRGLMMREGSSYLSLAIPTGVYQPNARVLRRVEQHLQRVGVAA
ncbi:hypothetical protein BE11_22530 [Sorangium cellulosum]|nr:hypothetical protein BE11_22530 [Sorangium cellulosum]